MRRTHRSILFSLLAVFVLLGGLAAPAFQTSAATPAPAEMASMPGTQVITYYAGPVENPAHIPPPDVFFQRASGAGTQTATIIVNYNGTWDANAQNAFQYAVNIWASLLTSPVAITVDAYWTTFDSPTVLGAAGPKNFAANFPNAPMTDTWYPVATANKLAGTDLDPLDYDIQAEFNKNFPNWYFGTDGNPGSQVDFVSVVLHELGHGLGFSGSMRVGGFCGTGNGCWGSGVTPLYPFIYDRFAVNGSGQYLISDFPNYSTELASQLTSNDIYFNGPNAVKANGNSNVKLYAPSTWVQGSSLSHLDEIFNNTPHALMTHSIGSGEAIHNPGSVTLCMFKDMGWTVTVSGASAVYAEAAPGFAAFSPDSVTVMVTSTVHLPLIMKTYSPSSPC